MQPEVGGELRNVLHTVWASKTHCSFLTSHSAALYSFVTAASFQLCCVECYKHADCANGEFCDIAGECNHDEQACCFDGFAINGVCPLTCDGVFVSQ